MKNTFADLEDAMNINSVMNHAMIMSPKPLSLGDIQDSTVSSLDCSPPDFKPPSLSLPPPSQSPLLENRHHDFDDDLIKPLKFQRVNKREAKQLDKKAAASPQSLDMYLSPKDKSKLAILNETIAEKTQELNKKLEHKSQ